MTPTDDVEALLGEVEARANAATEGPWKRWEGPGGGPGLNIVGADASLVACADGSVGRDDAWLPHVEPNAAFIAAARTDVPRLVAALRMALLCDEIDYGTLDTIAAILKGAKP